MAPPTDMVLGILGGLGPEATVNFLDVLVDRTPAETDQDHLETIVYSDPKVADRNEAILRDGESPLPRLERNARRLELTGADRIVIASNTTHYYHDEIARAVDVPVPNMIEVTADSVSPNVDTVGVLTTTTAREIGLYDDAFTEATVAYPEQMDVLMDAIYAFKSGDRDEAIRLFDSAVEPFLATDIETVVLGCTEFSVLDWNYSIDVIDPVEHLVDYCLRTSPSEDDG